MHYYKRNIGDYAKKAGKLSMLQHGAYTVLIDACYDRERFPTMEEAIDWAWASTAAEIEAVEFVLRKFFTLVDGRYTQERILEEVEAYKRNCEINSRIATNREAKRKESSTDREPLVNDPPPNHKPITINQEPETKRESEDGRKKRRHTDDDLKCAEWIAGKIREALPDAKKPNLNMWGDDIRLMREVDKRTHREICDLFQWAAKDSFWHKNILSPSKLRDKWDQLTLARGSGDKAAPKPATHNLGANAPVFADPFARKA